MRFMAIKPPQLAFDGSEKVCKRFLRPSLLVIFTDKPLETPTQQFSSSPAHQSPSLSHRKKHIDVFTPYRHDVTTKTDTSGRRRNQI